MEKISIDWSRTRTKSDLKPALTRYKLYLESLGLKDNTIILYIKLVKAYLENIETDMPTPTEASDYLDSLHQKKLSKGAINNFAAAIIKYHSMIKKPVKLPFMKLNNSLPYYFDEMDILKVFDVCSNIKHLCM